MEGTASHGDSLAYEEKGRGFPVVFVHGLTFNRRTWTPITDRLADRFRCIAIDLPGHGDSPGLPQSFEDVGRAVHAVVTDLGIDRPVVVGHSLGAMMATMYAAHYPAAGVVNVDQTLDVEPFGRMLHQLEPALRGPNFAAAFEPIRQSIGVELLPEPLRSSTLAAQVVRQDLILAYWDDPLRRSPEDLQTLIDEAIGGMESPYLAVFGHQLSEVERVRLYGRLPHLELEEWPQRGHMVHLMEPHRFTDRVAAFVHRCAATGREPVPQLPQ
jgi:pimeloyl-ACP methyl ester carboxylesterase